MIALPVTPVPTSINASPVLPQGGHVTGSFAAHLAVTTAPHFKFTSQHAGSSAVASSLPLHKVATKKDSTSQNAASASSTANPAPTAANPATTTPLQNTPASTNSGVGSAAPDAATGSATATTLLANSGNAPTVTLPSPANRFVLAAPLGTGTTIQLGPNLSSPQPANNLPNPISPGTPTSSSVAAPKPPAPGQFALPVTPPVNPSAPPPIDPAAQNQAKAPAAPIPGIADQTGTQATTPQPAQADVSGANNSANSASSNPPPPGAAELNARIVAGAATLSAQPSVALTSVANALLQPRDPNAGVMPASSAPISTDKTHGAAGLPPSGDSGGNGTATGDATAELRNFTTALNHASTPVRDQSPDLPADNAKAAAPATRDAADSSASDTALASAQPNTPADPALQAPNDGSVRTNLITLPASEQVAIHLRQAIKDGSNEIQIQLKPASLGAIDVKLNVNHDGRLTAVISADRSDTLNLLKQDAGHLQQALRDAGFNADSGSLSFSLRGDAQSFTQNASQRSGASAPTTVLADQSDAFLAARAFRQHSGTIDIQV